MDLWDKLDLMLILDDLPVDVMGKSVSKHFIIWPLIRKIGSIFHPQVIFPQIWVTCPRIFVGNLGGYSQFVVFG